MQEMPRQCDEPGEEKPRAIEVEDLCGKIVVDGVGGVAVPEWLSALLWVNHQRSLGRLPN
jgi:hypothetical protein